MAKVMIVENSEKPCLSAKNLLDSINHEIVFETSNGYEAIEKYDEIQPDLLLLDLVLSKHDGMSVFREIRKNHPESKIIILTLLPDKNLLEECKNSGAYACLTIPFKLKDFLTIVTSISDSTKIKTKATPIISD